MCRVQIQGPEPPSSPELVRELEARHAHVLAPVLREEVDRALSKTKSGKSAGTDGIVYKAVPWFHILDRKPHRRLLHCHSNPQKPPAIAEYTVCVDSKPTWPHCPADMRL